MADKVKVYDATGVGRHVHPVDAREIVAHGGSYAPGQAEVPDTKNKPKVTHPAEVKAPVEAVTTPEVVEDKPKGKPGRKPKS